MSISTNGANGTGLTNAEVFENVPCPFCGLLCDDLQITRTGRDLKVDKNGCKRSAAGFERPLPQSSPQIDGRDVSLDEAIAEATRLIRASALPIYGGMATDVEGSRAILALADRSGGVVDHAYSEALYRNYKVLQSSGWVMSSLTEARNRADVIVIVATDVQYLHPRFFERIVNPPETLFDDPPLQRTIIFLGKGMTMDAAAGPRVTAVYNVPCENAQVGELLEALRVLLRGQPVDADSIAGVPKDSVVALAEKLKAAKYGIFAWSSSGLDFPNADLAVQSLCDLIKELNLTTRTAGLPLGGGEGAVSAGAVCGWQVGFPLRVSFASGKPDYNPQAYALDRMLAAGDGDLLVWVASFSPDVVPPANTLPTVVLGTPGLKLTSAPRVFIPVGTPGVDHAGRLLRSDSVVSLNLRNLQRSSLPRAADILARIEAAL